MSVNPMLRSLAQDGRISLADAQKMKQAVAAGTVSQAEIKDATSRYAEAIDDDAATLLSDTFQCAGRAKLTSLPDALTSKTLSKGMHSGDVSTLQRGLMSAGLMSQREAMALKSGADGIFGAETEASVRAFQKVSGLPATGIADPATLKALNQAMGSSARTTTPQPANVPTPTPAVRPSTGLRSREANAVAPPAPPPAAAAAPAAAAGAPAPSIVSSLPPPPPVARAAPTVGVTLPAGVPPGSAAAVIAAGTELATGSRAVHYGADNAWRNIDPRHNAPVDVRMGGLKDRWKCNLFGGNTLAAAGFEPPYYNNAKKGGEYPVAEQWHKWSTPSAELKARSAAAGCPAVDEAKKSRHQARFEMMDEMKPTAIADPAQRKARIEALLARVQPGDVVTVDHAGAAGSDGGHVRVCVGRDDTGRPLFAQAKQDAAHVVPEGVNDANWSNEDAIYILRPNTPRQ